MKPKIYIVVNKSYEADFGDGPSESIEVVTTSEEFATTYFNKYCTDLPESDTWIYEYELREYNDGYSYAESLSGEKPTYTVKLHTRK